MSETEIKICGLSTPEAVDAAVTARVTHIGLVHYEPSPRHVTLDQAGALRARVPQGIKVVLLLVNQQPQPTAQAIQAVRPDVVQFHGAETPEWLALLKQNTPLEIWKAVGVRDAQSLEKVQRFKGAVDKLLYDAPANKLPGGNGLALDWSLLANFRHEIPWGLAGGLTPENVGDAIRQTGAPLVDTSSGVESAPGVKDVERIAAFCRAARA
ncbi:MAG TPA: phosphoribosylanthranilate isomerase [Croceibacterium sp.]|nr:phosphoribosylanthranilate isomerase [Croceibacterium sp.]